MSPTTLRKAKRTKKRRSAGQRRSGTTIKPLLQNKVRTTVADIERRKLAEALKQSEEQHRFLSRASGMLSASLDYETTLKNVADLMVPKLAEWCTVHIKQEDGAIQQLAIAHADPKMLSLARELNKKYPPDYDAPRGIGQIFRSGKPEMVPVIPDEMLVQGAKDAYHLKVLRDLKLGSYMCVPMIARGRTIGVLTLLSVVGKHYTDADLEFAQQLASRAALAVDNARLYKEAHRALEEVRALNRRLEEKVAERTREVQEAQQKDRVNLQRIRFMIQRLPIAALALDEDDVILEANMLFCQLLGLQSRPAALIGRARGDALREWKENVVDFDAHERAMRDAVASSKVLLGQEMLMNDGRILLRDVTPIVEGGRKYGCLLTYRDVTKDRRIDAAKSEFMSLASHQLRTPLTGIRLIFGRLDKNLDGQLGELEQRLLDEGKGAAARMSKTISTMLQISRIQSGQIEINRQEVSLDGFLEELVKAYRGEAAARSQTLSVTCEQGLSVVTDPHLLHEVMCNLLSNALKYTPQNGTISLNATQRGPTIEITVQDSGYGIPQHQQAKVFHKFFRGDNVVSKDPDGTGLGLYMASLITDLLGGTIGFESAEGRGTTFRLALPAA